MKVFVLVEVYEGKVKTRTFATRLQAEAAFRAEAQDFTDEASIEIAAKAGELIGEDAQLLIMESDLEGATSFAIEVQLPSIEDAQFDMDLWRNTHGTLTEITAVIEGQKTAVAYAVNGAVAEQLCAGLAPLEDGPLAAAILQRDDGFETVWLEPGGIAEAYDLGQAGKIKGVTDGESIVAYCHTDHHDRLLALLNLGNLAQRNGVFPL